MKYTLEERKELYELLRLQEKYVACKGACNVMSDYVALRGIDKNLNEDVIKLGNEYSAKLVEFLGASEYEEIGEELYQLSQINYGTEE